MPRVQPEEFKAWNERMVHKYDPDAFHHHPNPFVRFVERKRVRVIFDLLKIQPGDRVLEVGCGAGNVMEQANEGEVFGTDISETILLKAKKKAEGGEPSLPGRCTKFTLQESGIYSRHLFGGIGTPS